MAYDETLAERIREQLAERGDVTEKKMFGGLAFLVGGNMAVAASGQGGLLLRIDPAQAEVLTGEPHVSRFEMRGRAMDGWLHVAAAAVERDEDVQRWVDVGLGYARTLPAK